MTMIYHQSQRHRKVLQKNSREKIKIKLAELKEFLKTTFLKNEDKPVILCGFPGDPFYKSPFVSTFVK